MVRAEQRFHFFPELRVRSTRTIEKRGALLRRQVKRVVIELTNLPISIGIHP
jgi:hypothetical protein